MEKKMVIGLVFVGIGVLMILNIVFGVSLPIFRVLAALFVTYIGLSMLFGSFGINFKMKKISSANEAIFTDSHFSWDWDQKPGRTSRQYNTVFGKGTLDLRNVDLSSGSVDMKMNTLFGETKLLVKKGTPLTVQTHSVFGAAELPNKNINAFGQFTYESENVDRSKPALNVEANVVFGHFQVEQF